MENWKWKEEKLQNEERTLLFVCLFFLLTFQNDYDLFWVYQNGNFLLGKNQAKMTLPPQKNCPVTPLMINITPIVIEIAPAIVCLLKKITRRRVIVL